MKKAVQYVLIFVLFLTIGSLIATFFAKSEHEVSMQRTVAKSVDSCWNYLSDTMHATQWMTNLIGIHSKSTNDSAWVMEATYKHSSGTELNVEQKWYGDSDQKSLTIRSSVEGDLDMIQEVRLLQQEHTDSTIILLKNTIQIHSWLNRLLMTGLSGESGLPAQTAAEIDRLATSILKR
ncbi:MAG: hypothetical protein H6608_05680 [Flavobacteriales bacterium]|nr:hypothetical protein [Bacteroidota bacterium]MCB9240597.1 hypothetical protein [Flavobacteriales bacterium]